MQNKIVDLLLKFRKLAFIQVLQRTLLSIFPIVLISSFCLVLNNSFLRPDSFFGQITNIKSWLPSYNYFIHALDDIVYATSGVLAIYSTFLSAKITRQKYHFKSVLVEVTSVITYLLIFMTTDRNRNYDMRYSSGYWVVLGIIIGYLVALLFVKFGNSSDSQMQNRDEIMADVFANFKPFLSLQLFLLYLFT